MSYREYTPPPPLAPWLACTWEHQSAGDPPVRVVPDGCIDVVWTEGAGTTVVGANTTAFLVALTAGTLVVGARLWPGTAPALLGVDAESLRDARASVEDVWGDDGCRLAAALDEREDHAGALLSALVARARHAAPPDPLVRAAVARLDNPLIVVSGLARDLGVSERQLRRRTRAAVGYGPKRLARVLRLGRALAAARAGDDLGRVAHDAGYADQAHFAHDCGALAGAAPSAVLAA